MSDATGEAGRTSSFADDQLAEALRAVAEGDQHAFERVYRLTSPKLLAVCRRVVRERQEAEEALQEAYLNVWRRADRYEPARGRPMTWLITIAHRCAIDRLRARSMVAGPWSDSLPESEAAAGWTELADSRLGSCLRMLDHADEQLLRTAFFEGATYADIARGSATPLGTIKSRIRRALMKLAECLR